MGFVTDTPVTKNAALRLPKLRRHFESSKTEIIIAQFVEIREAEQIVSLTSRVRTAWLDPAWITGSREKERAKSRRRSQASHLEIY